MSSTNGTRAAVLAAMLVLSVAAGVAVTGVMAQQGSQNEIKLELSSTQPHSPTGVTGTGAIDGTNVLPPQVPGNKKTGKLKKLIIKSGGGLDFSGLTLIPPPTSGIDRNGDKAGTAIDKNLVPLLADLKQKNNHHTLVITLQQPVKVSVGDEIVISISEANGVKTGDAGHYTMKVIAVSASGERAAPATVEYTIGNVQTPDTPTQTPDTPTQTPDTPTQTPDTPTQTPDTPTQTPDTPTQTPDTPTQTPDTPTQTPEQPPQQPNKNTLRVEGSGEYSAYSFSADNVTLTEQDSEDTVNNDTAYGAVGPDSDTYSFTGELEDLSVAGSATVYVNGEKVDPSNYGSDVQVITFKGTGSYASYDFSASDEVEHGIYLDMEDSLNQGAGAVTAGLETYFVDGNVTNVTTDGNVNVVKS